jgi:hypothetical protein
VFCPNCGDEYRPGFTECAECLIPLVPEPPEEEPPEPPPPDENWGDVPTLAIVYRSSRVDADIMSTYLQNCGLPTSVGKEGYHSYWPFTVGVFGEGRVQVRECDVDDARLLIDSVRDGAHALAGDPHDDSLKMRKRIAICIYALFVGFDTGIIYLPLVLILRLFD